MAVDDVIILAAGRVLALPGKDLKEIAVEGFALGVPTFYPNTVSFFLGVGHQRSQRADRAIQVRRPIKTVLGSRRAV